MKRKPRLLDLFCCAGGAAMGYQRAGFDVVGVDHKAQPNYPFEFHQSDWLSFVQEHGYEFDVIHASPPCQSYSVTSAFSGTKAPRLIPAVREALEAIGAPYVIENVPGSECDLISPLTLRGNMFGLRVKRDRLFEVHPWMMGPPLVRMEGSANSHRGLSKLEPGGYITVAGHNFILKEAQQAMGIDWMNAREIAQAIPPAYTEWIGRRLMQMYFEVLAS